MALETGLSARIELLVTEADTAEALRSGSVPVLGTPRLVALCEEASCRATDGEIPEHCTTVGKRLQIDHLLPVSVGSSVWAEATLDRIEGRRLVFTLSVSGDVGLVAAGKLVRVIVDRKNFLSNVR